MNNIIAILIITALGLLGSVLLVIANKLFAVPKDERLEIIQNTLPSANCGACGFSGCAAYANAIVTENVAINLCIPGGEACAMKIGAVLNMTPDAVVKQKAVVACQGTYEHRKRHYQYEGIQSCAACSTLYGGDSTCEYGCLGYGDCITVCKFDAITLVDGVAKIDQEKCTGCGCCESACPKKVIWVREQTAQPVVMCANHQRGLLTKASCTAGCIGCMKCVRACSHDAIKVSNNVARIFMDKCTGCQACVSVCPVNAIAVLAPFQKTTKPN